MTRPVSIGSEFKLVFVAACLLAALCLLVAAVFALFVSSPNGIQTKVVETCLDLTKFGAGAIFGLLGGRMAKR